MSEKSHYHERIHRATQQLAQHQARELLAGQRKVAKEKEKQRREEAQRRRRVVELVFLAGAETLEDDELLGALLLYLDQRTNPMTKESAKEWGAAALAPKPSGQTAH